MPRYSEAVPTVSGWVDEDGKEALMGHPLSVAAVDFDAKNVYGPRWVYTIDVLATGERLLLGLKDNPVRQQISEAMRNAIRTAQGEAIGPVSLYQIEVPEGAPAGSNPTWAFRDSTDEEMATALAARDLRLAAEAEAPEALPGETLAKSGKAAK